MSGAECRYCWRRALPGRQWCNLALATRGRNKTDAKRIITEHTHAMEIIDARPLGIKFLEDAKRDRRSAWEGPDNLLRDVLSLPEPIQCIESGCQHLAVITQVLAADPARCWTHQPAVVQW